VHQRVEGHDLQRPSARNKWCRESKSSRWIARERCTSRLVGEFTRFVPFQIQTPALSRRPQSRFCAGAAMLVPQPVWMSLEMTKSLTGSWNGGDSGRQPAKNLGGRGGETAETGSCAGVNSGKYQRLPALPHVSKAFTAVVRADPGGLVTMFSKR
jgi:hypothetical protein